MREKIITMVICEAPRSDYNLVSQSIPELHGRRTYLTISVEYYSSVSTKKMYLKYTPISNYNRANDVAACVATGS